MTDRIPAFVIALASGHRQIGEMHELVLGERELHRRGVLLDIAAPLGPGDRDDVRALREDPGERELRRGHALLLGELSDPRGELTVGLEVRVDHRLQAAADPRMRAYAELVRGGDGNEAQRLALREAHREDVRERFAEVTRTLATANGSTKGTASAADA